MQQKLLWLWRLQITATRLTEAFIILKNLKKFPWKLRFKWHGSSSISSSCTCFSIRDLAFNQNLATSWREV